MGGWYVVEKTIDGRRYLYRQRTWREGASVRTESEYLAPCDGHTLARGVSQPRGRFRPISEDQAEHLWKEGKLTGSAFQMPEKFITRLRRYGGFDIAGGINKALRYDRSMTPEDGNTHLHLRWVLAHPEAKLLHDVVLYRGTRLPTARVVPGKVFEDSGFMSFSTSRGVAEGFAEEFEKEPKKGWSPVVLRLEGRSGDKGYIQMTGVGILSGEKEILRGRGRFVISHIETDKNRNICYIKELREEEA